MEVGILLQTLGGDAARWPEVVSTAGAGHLEQEPLDNIMSRREGTFPTYACGSNSGRLAAAVRTGTLPDTVPDTSGATGGSEETRPTR